MSLKGAEKEKGGETFTVAANGQAAIRVGERGRATSEEGCYNCGLSSRPIGDVVRSS